MKTRNFLKFVPAQRAFSGMVLLVGSVGLANSASAGDEAPVTLHYVQRPPYMVAAEEGLTGLTGGPSYQAFKKAGVPVVVKETPFARQLNYVEMNIGQDCMIGMYKTAERQKFAKYSQPIYQSQPHVLLTSAASASRLAAHATLESVYGDQSLVLLVKLGYSYGAAMDALIEKYQPKRQTTTDENLAMLRQIKQGMADYMLIAPEEAQGAIEAAGFKPADFRQFKPRNMPPGDYRHLMCSKNVPDTVMQKLNAAIRFNK
ncbi:transporter substrate-binding domain-containing protein [Curvibacter sp. APW13]|uniref:substrate-binding periplasmic protein n=1 Tax=Curvibacter sp. APW13 TaxID=3077236 RepID=UPI0028DF18D1|nr:transporter substrate-binding domain-containing protein [Curvibacter sp. APW13]MDT8992950.1 transporter substrate-binding domain-containing protein [Curvibacter sp. APW13]